MKIKFKATARAVDYIISNETINGFDLSVIEHGGQFIGDESTRAAGIRDAWRDASGELFVVLQQALPLTRTTYIIEGKPHTYQPGQVSEDGDSIIVSGADGDTQTLGPVERRIEHHGGHWRESEWIDAADYNPNTLYIKEV